MADFDVTLERIAVTAMLKHVFDSDGVRWRKAAVFDGHGETAEVHLQLEDLSGGGVIDLPWPKSWPRSVNDVFLKRRGYNLVFA